MKTTVLLLSVFFSVMVLNSNAAYKYSVQSGAWNQNSTWSGSTVPVCGDSILISPSHTVIVNNQVSYNCSSKTTVVIKGELNFDGGNKLSMPCDSRVYVLGGGRITSDGGGNSNRIEICSTVLWSASVGQISGPACLPSNLEGCAQVMPVELIAFDAQQCGNSICLSWKTATEHNNDFFVVQKLSGDVFVDMATIKSKSTNGNSKHLLAYDTKDDQPVSGLNYYRLKQFDFDGSFFTSRIVVVTVNPGQTKTEVFPNPSSGNITLSLDKNTSHKVNILDASGTVVRTENISGEEHVQVIGLSPGFYYCLVKSAAQTETIKIVVQ